jgi:DNA-binding SARP family transcriptional activator
MTSPPRRRARIISDVVGSVLTALLAFGATPLVLFLLVGDPLGHGLGHTWSHASRLTLTVLAGLAWVAWMGCCLQLIRDVRVHVRRGSVASLVGAALSERVAARIAAGILTISALGTPLAFTGAAGASAPAVTHVAAPVAVATQATPASTNEPAAVATTYIVRAGDSLWTIAEMQLGDGADWTAIARLNLGHTMPDGLRFVDPSLIRPGWTLALPSAAPAPSDPTAYAFPAPHQHPVAAAPLDHSPVTPRVETVHTVSRLVAVAPKSDTRQSGPAPVRQLPEIAMLGLSAIGCAALARRSRRRRAVGLQHGRSSVGWGRASDLIDTESMLTRFADIPALSAFERANSLIGRLLQDEAALADAPQVRAVCVGPAGVDFWLSRRSETAPTGCTALNDGMTWRVSHDELDDEQPICPWLSIVLPVGGDDQGSWLVPVPPGTCLPLLGESAEHLWRSVRPVQESWSWADNVMVTDDPSCLTQWLASSPPSSDLPPILFFGDPTVLPAGAARRISVVTTSPLHATDVAILVDPNAATIHPLGRTVRPDLVDDGTARLMDELARPFPDASDDEPEVTDEAELPEPIEGADFLAPGQVEVKLLGPTPRLEGLQEGLPANRARRAVELVAYLALHAPDEVTGDRLRTRVLGSSDADAASKTLFNTAAAARRAMGSDAQGGQLFPSGSRTGHYRVSELVTVDVHRACQLATFGNSCEDADMAITFLRAALELIEGEPMANVLSGYTWWEAEGHGGRLAAVLVNAACNLAALSVQAGRYELAQWGLGQARLVDPYSEALSRTAMQVAAAAGDADRLRREWLEYQRRVDELDPGSAPSPRTERLYGELKHRVLVGATAVQATELMA